MYVTQNNIRVISLNRRGCLNSHLTAHVQLKSGFLDFTEARDNRWQWRQLNHMQIIYILLQTDNHAGTLPLSFYRPDALPATQLTVSKH